MKKLLLLVWFAVPLFANAQSISITKVELAGEKVIVHYNLEYSNAAQGFLINLYGSKDNFGVALSKVTGDVGPEVKPGTDKKIEWKLRDEYGGYKGRLALEIRGKVYTPFVKLQDFDVSKTYKRGKSYDILWKPGNADPVNIELYNGTQRVQGDMGQPNSGAFTIHIPSTLKPGKEYRLKFTDSRNPDEVLFTPNFKIAPQIPTVVKIAVPLILVGGVVFILSNSGGTPENDNNTNKESDIELPPVVK